MTRNDIDPEVRRRDEADWKAFRELRELALERFCERTLREVRDLTQAKGSSHERYLKIYRLLQNRDKKIAIGFNDVRRSTMDEHLVAIHSLDLLTPEEMTRFSDDRRNMVERWVGKRPRR